ncbi:hypothetical protein TanjilG_22918 [Lupinus angustifolius]|uniref:Uncharacterized protein n=1 Tax=Lupinus angustifolius TaxID=3871 RepID=A0A1J7HE36_LUPAN|nr:hypothetical protein TanjilG_22918 [Lupinus angustifolius]
MFTSIVSSSTIIRTCLFLFFLFTFTSARYTFVSTEVDIDQNNLDSYSVSENNVPAKINTNILLPKQNNEFKSSTLFTNSKSSKPKAESIDSIQLPKETHPFRGFNFRSIEPRILRCPLPLYFRHRHHCRHNHRYKPLKPRFPRREDVTVENVEEDKDFDAMARGGVRSEIPAEWTRFPEIEPMFLSRDRNMAMERSEMMRRLYNRRHHCRHHRHHHGNDSVEQENKGNRLMKRIRKFLKTKVLIHV